MEPQTFSVSFTWEDRSRRGGRVCRIRVDADQSFRPSPMDASRKSDSHKMGRAVKPWQSAALGLAKKNRGFRSRGPRKQRATQKPRTGETTPGRLAKEWAEMAEKKTETNHDLSTFHHLTGGWVESDPRACFVCLQMGSEISAGPFPKKLGPGGWQHSRRARTVGSE